MPRLVPALRSICTIAACSVGLASHVRADDIISHEVGGANLRLIDLSAILNVSVGASTGTAEELGWSQSGSHDPTRTGFDFNSLEISLAGAVDPYFTMAAHLLITPDHGLELEEAFATSSSLPHGFEVEAGYMLTEFGRYNPVHAHEYAHIDQPLVIGRMFGGEGTRDIGMRVGWLLPTDWFSELHLTAQNGDDGTAVSFLGEGHSHGGGDGHDHGGEEEEGDFRHIDRPDDLLWTGRWVNGFAMGEDAEIQIGVSGSYGPNLQNDHTTLYGTDIVFKWYNPDATGGAGTLAWTTEFIARDMGAADPEEEMDDWGVVSVVTYQFTRNWKAGFRLDYVDQDAHGDDEHDHDHDEEEHDHGEDEHDHEDGPEEIMRLSPLVVYQPSEFTKFRLQYNYSDSNAGDPVHSVWLGLEVLIGTHPAHKF